MESLCRLRPLHSGLSPAVFRDLQWADISESGLCQCWMMTLNQLKPGHRALLYSALQEVMMVLFTDHTASLCLNVSCDKVATE